ncbi:MAG: tetrathionate reductase family octaheme c-type cytochrome, partial [Rhodocyclaceae bacterium]|nr:tetrathionate reductase family octaheme c-type cytochrome [Rhodocyclaceae bacterium]
FKELQQDFKSGPEVTKACLVCHTEAAKQVQHTKHWTWEVEDPRSGKKLGKKNIINNFCTSTISNEKDCMACHAGYGWEDKGFDFAKEENVDCLICHDATGIYRKLPGDAGHPIYERKEFPHGSGKFVEPVDLKKVAQNVAMPSRANCGSCHFYGAGGDGTKHGDLDSSLRNPQKYLDVHMDAKGLNFSCVTCHKTSQHQVAGSRYAFSASRAGPPQSHGKHDENPATCQSCHGDKPHKESLLDAGRLNAHTGTLACQTCHIPEFARGSVGTEKVWDWSTATQMGPDGKPRFVKDSVGRRAFDSKKGHFEWDAYLQPEYRWFNGQVTFKTVGEKIDPTRIVEINRPEGNPGETGARIWPFKVHRGRQAYDPELKNLLVVHTAGEDHTALWHNYDWPKAIETGMRTAGLPWSGKYDFVATEMSWPITHMVAPRADAVPCAQCHGAASRLKGIDGIWLPGLHRNEWLDLAGWSAALLALVGVLIHGGLRICVLCRKPRKTS